MKQRKDGRFCAQKRLAGNVVSVYGATAEEAREKLESISAPLPQISVSPTVHEIAQSIWGPTLAGRVSESSASKYVGIYKKHIRDIIGTVPISEINRPVLNCWLSEVISAPAKRDAKTVLRQIFESAIDIGLIDANPVSGLKVPPKAAKREKALDPEDAAQLLELVSGTPLSFPVFAALVLGLRQGEIAGLKWEDLNRQKGELHVRRQRRASPGHGVVESELKTAKSKAVLHLPKPFIAELDARGDLDNLYMTTYRGLPWVPNTIGQFW
ncbi:MAG: tyrosine-type recombinase/integrase, partial [Rhabdochlamydiaceae bacterium]